MAKTLLEKIKDKSAVIGIIGLGYVGLPLVIRFGEEDFKVIGFDIDRKKINKLNKGKSYIKHIPAKKIRPLVVDGKFAATSDYSRLKEADCIIICVPTPLDNNKAPDLSFIENTTEKIALYLRKGQLVSLESTTYPGTTREVVLPKLQNKHFRAGKDFFLVFSPERENPGESKYSTKNIPKVVGGITRACTEAGIALYRQIIEKVIPLSSPEAAEFTKILENTFRSVNIALVNELKILATKMGVDIWEVIKAAATKPFGFMPFYPGPGLGGHCIPIDPYYLSWKAKEFNFNTRFIELAGEINTGMPNYVVSVIAEALNRKGKCLKNAKILLLGVAYKKDVDDMRESPALEIIELLQERGAEVFYNDPYIPHIPQLRKYDLKLSSIPLSKRVLKRMDAVVIVTDHSSYDYSWIVKKAALIIDSRNATFSAKKGRHKIFKA